ncbi:C3a anaphylatoxin chemotactic receptor-like [Hyla sarda]|uniref:C3a anaphylatoxin chemotactic receptor-like n=1 Tax=Hyla sarda TaxID=327740 RepID=UPI0024C3E090|nr:C3a anaphylatoxin chemotactic receptor-like [Hyla sarda]
MIDEYGYQYYYFYYPYYYYYYYDYENLNDTYVGNYSYVINLPDTQLLNTISTLSTALYSVAFFFGVIGNSIVIWIAACKMKNISSVWFLNLAAVDFICCASLPLRIIESNLDYADSFTHDLCRIGSSILSLTMSTSVNFLTVMSIDRFVSTMWPFWSKIYRTRRTVRVISFFVWILSLFLNSPYILLNNLYQDVSDCYFKDGSANKTYRFNMYISKFVISFAAPFLIILFCYGGVLFQVKNVKKNKKSFRPYRIVTAVIVSFFITGFPYHSWRLIPVLKGKLRNTDFILYSVFNCMAYFNSCTNPILYVIIGEHFKISFMSTFLETTRIFIGRFKRPCGEKT